MRFIKGLFAFLFITAVLGAAALLGGWFWLNNELAKPGPHQTPIEFTVKAGEGFASVATRLESDGIVSDDRLLRLKARLDGVENAIKAGTYIIPAQSSPNLVMDQLIAGDVIQLKVTIPEGLTTAQILRRVETSDALRGEMPTEPIPEGVLLPDTYLVDVGTTRTQFLERMKQAQIALLNELWPTRQPDLPISTAREAVILASVVEKESGAAAERGKIAGLFTGRLKRGMRLESDPTIIYGVSKGEPLYNRQGHRRTLYRSEIDRKTDWNTYQIDGLPKTPICNPGRDAIAAVLNPPETNYVFFVADGKGGHLFAETYAEHLKNVAQYRKYEAEEIARERGN